MKIIQINFVDFNFVYAWISFILLNTFLGRQLYNFLISLGGRSLVIIIMGILAGCCLIFVWRKIDKTKLFQLVLLLFLGVTAALFLNIAEERLHIVKFGFLGFLVMTSSIISRKKGAILGISLAILDEGIQTLLPYRVGDIRDVAINLLSLLWGIAMGKCGGKDKFVKEKFRKEKFEKEKN